MRVPTAAVPIHERPRERLLALGAKALTERELVAVLLRNGTQGVSAVDRAASILADYGSLRALAAARPEELAAKAGIGAAKATALVAAFELGRRTDRHDEPIILRCPEGVAQVARR